MWFLALVQLNGSHFRTSIYTLSCCYGSLFRYFLSPAVSAVYSFCPDRGPGWLTTKEYLLQAAFAPGFQLSSGKGHVRGLGIHPYFFPALNHISGNGWLQFLWERTSVMALAVNHARAQSCLILSDPTVCNPPGSTRILEWVAISFSKGSS